MTPRQIKIARKRILSEGYYRDRAIALAEQAAGVQIDLHIAAKKKQIDRISELDDLLTKLNFKLGWYFGKI